MLFRSLCRLLFIRAAAHIQLSLFEDSSTLSDAVIVASDSLARRISVLLRLWWKLNDNVGDLHAKQRESSTLLRILSRNVRSVFIYFAVKLLSAAGFEPASKASSASCFVVAACGKTDARLKLPQVLCVFTFRHALVKLFTSIAPTGEAEGLRIDQ